MSVKEQSTRVVAVVGVDSSAFNIIDCSALSSLQAGHVLTLPRWQLPSGHLPPHGCAAGRAAARVCVCIGWCIVHGARAYM